MPAAKQDGAHSQRARACYVQRGAPHPVAHQLRVHQEGLPAQHPQVRTQWRVQDVHVPCRVPVSPGRGVELKLLSVCFLLTDTVRNKYAYMV